jgi:membrane dipeptidase
MATTVTDEQVATLHERALVVNMLGGITHFPSRANLSFVLPEIMRRGGTTAVSWTIAGVREQFAETAQRFANALDAIDACTDPRARLVRSAADIREAKARGEAAIIINFQNTDPLEGRLEYLSLFHRLGLRVVQLTYQRRNLVGDGCGEPGEGAGLSLFGRELIEELNRLGILIDLSHCNDRTTLEAIEHSGAPVSLTHVNLRSLNPHARNKPDDHIRLVAEQGGVIGINSVARMISPRGNAEGASLSQYIDQIDYVVGLAGVDHVGIGLDRVEDLTAEDMEQRRRTFLTQYPELRAGGDFPFENYYTRDLSMGTMANLTRGLLERGYAEDGVLKLLGGNFLGLLERVWK